MKKIFFIWLVFFVFITNIAISNELNGYRGVTWGASISEVEEKFGNLILIQKYVEDIVKYEQISVEEKNIKNREFKFHKGKLVEIFNELLLKKNNWELAIEKLNETYGKYHKTQEKEERLFENKSDMLNTRSYIWNLPKMNIIFEKHTTQTAIMKEYGRIAAFYYITYSDPSFDTFLEQYLYKRKQMRQQKKKENIEL